MKILSTNAEHIYTVEEIGEDDPPPKGITVCPLDLIVTREFVDRWSRFYAAEDAVREESLAIEDSDNG